MKRGLFVLSFVLVLSFSGVGSCQDFCLDTLIAQVQSRLEELEDVSLRAEITQYVGGREVLTVADLSMSVPYGLARVEILAPTMLRGQIVVADEQARIVKMYMPIANTIMVQDMDKMALEAGLSLDLLDMSKLLNFLDVEVTLFETMKDERGTVYVLEVQTDEIHRQKVWLLAEGSIPLRVEVYEQSLLVGVMVFSAVKMNVGLDVEKLRELPNVREVTI